MERLSGLQDHLEDAIISNLGNCLTQSELKVGKCKVVRHANLRSGIWVILALLICVTMHMSPAFGIQHCLHTSISKEV